MITNAIWTVLKRSLTAKFPALALPLWLALSGMLWGQWRGQVTDPQGQALADVNIFIENSFIGTVSNAQGRFELTPDREKGVLIFKYLGFETHRIPFDSAIGNQPLEIQLKPISITLEEVQLQANENPALRIIKAAQGVRKQNLERSKRFRADYYSRGIIRTENFPERFLGQELNELNEILDSNRNGILYLSETRSKIFAQGREFKEVISASKVSGDDRGFSFNSAQDSDFNFYESRIEVENPVESPIGPNALGYYRYRLENTFYTPEGQLINQIEVRPKLPGAGTFQGTLYIVEDDWTFYGLELQYDKKGSVLDQLQIQQIFNYNASAQQWVKTSQVIDFNVGVFGFEFNGRFSGVYSNFELDPIFEPKTFDRVVFEVLPGANTKDSLFWEQRPIPLTWEEQTDYIKKEQLQEKRSSEVYLDSLDRENNRWKWGDITGKEVRNSKKQQSLSLRLPLLEDGFNPVSGFKTGLEIGVFKGADSLPKNWNWKTGVSYGWSDHQWYPYFEWSTRRNRIRYTRYSFGLGKSLRQFDSSPGIDNFRSSFANLFYKENFIRLYESNYIRGSFSSRVFPFVELSYAAQLEYRERRVNTTDFSFFKRDDTYAANVPYLTGPLYDHQMFTHAVELNFSFGVKEMRYPDRIFYRSSDRWPNIKLKISQGIGEKQEQNFVKFRLRMLHEFTLGDLGQSRLALETGGFLDKTRPEFIDRNHFGGNRTYLIRNGDYAFQMMPHYQFSTTENYFRLHWNHNFGNNKIARLPLLRMLKAAPYIQTNLLTIDYRKPYFEGIAGLKNLGFGKFRFLTLAYGQLRYNKQVDHSFLFGIGN